MERHRRQHSREGGWGGVRQGEPLGWPSAPADSPSGVEASAGRVEEAPHQGVQDEGHKLKRKGERAEVKGGGGGAGVRRGGEGDRAHGAVSPPIRPPGDTSWRTRQADPEDGDPAAGGWCWGDHREAGSVGHVEVGTWRCRLLMRQVMPKPTSSRLVRVKALMALVSFWISR